MADIVLKNRNGNPVQYPGVEKIKVNTVDGETAEFVDSAAIPEVVENLPIALDFSGGDQTITAPNDMVVKSAIIQQPENLIPANIAEGVDIAGIIGTLAAGGGNVKVASGIFTGADAPAVVEHGLGVKPDVVYVNAVSESDQFANTFTTNRNLVSAFGVSEAMGKVFTWSSWGTVGNYYGVYRQGTKSENTSSFMKLKDTVVAFPIETTPGMSRCIHSANAQSFTVGPSGFYQIPTNGQKYAWFAIGGLT